MRLLRAIDNLLNAITMYRVVLYGLGVLVLFSFLFSFLGLLSFTPASLFTSVVTLLILCLSMNFIFAKLFNVPTNVESAAISSFILYFILTPLNSLANLQWYVLACFFAMGSKYFLSIKKKLVFNPVALGVFVIGFLGSAEGVWWVGSAVLLPVALIIGLIIVRKTRRFHLFLSFLVTATLIYTIQSFIMKSAIQESLSLFFSSWPVIFFGTVMLTEPLTTPPKKNLQVIYGILVGVLFSLQFHFGRLFSTPELALLIGNIFSYLVSSKERVVLELVGKRELAKHIYEFVFQPDVKLQFEPGQYLEWTLSPAHADSRGNRRYFTIASSPTEDEVKVGVHLEPAVKSSSFKKILLHMKNGEKILASQLAGDFVMPETNARKLVFIAGGIGVTPFRSMVKYLLDTKQKRNIVLIYSASDPKEFAYKDIFAEAEEKIGLKVIYLVTNTNISKELWSGYVGRLNEQVVKKEIPDYTDRTFYLSGPNRMVEAYKKLLGLLGIKYRNIVTDYFPGF